MIDEGVYDAYKKVTGRIIYYESTNKGTYFAKLSIILVVSIGTCQCNLCA